MPKFLLATLLAALFAFVARGSASAEFTSSITLSALPDATGRVITYSIDARWEPAGQPEFDFATPLGTTLDDVSSMSGVGSLEAVMPDESIVKESDPQFAAKVRGQAPLLRFGFAAGATHASATLRVRVAPTWQGPAISAQAYFRGTGVAQSGVISTLVPIPLVTGLVAVRRFVDLNGDLQFAADDVPEQCHVYVYTDLSGTRVPDDVASPTDRRLPLGTLGESDSTGTATFALAPGRYAVYTASCDVPPPAGGAPQTAFDVRQQPAATPVLSESGANRYDVQIVDVAADRQTDAITGEQPVGALAPPTGVMLTGRGVNWDDRATGESGYHLVGTWNGQPGAFDLPANATSFVLPEALQARCGENVFSVSLAAFGAGGSGYSARADGTLIVDCFGLSTPATMPDTGASSRDRAHSRTRFALVVMGIGAVATVAGVLGARRRIR